MTDATLTPNQPATSSKQGLLKRIRGHWLTVPALIVIGIGALVGPSFITHLYESERLYQWFQSASDADLRQMSLEELSTLENAVEWKSNGLPSEVIEHGLGRIGDAALEVAGK